jgi:FPC/CPF motif-containing protein YcgG
LKNDWKKWNGYIWKNGHTGIKEMKQHIKKRLKKLEKALSMPDITNLVAEERHGIVTWNGVQYTNRDELDKAMKKFGGTPDRPLVILKRFS